ncbi:MAG: BglI family type II restriction endonuclease [Dehalococcoidia bacterium]|nr:BglI family type II restriction endonuclease [Dehalococcoidia bacterium]
MTLSGDALRADLEIIEQVEKATLRMVAQAIHDFRDDAIEIFAGESDLVADIGEDITREALDRQGMPTIPIRLFGKIDYKRATYLFQPEYSVRQALFVDSKAEKIAGSRSATIQTSQTSMHIRQIRQRQPVNVLGEMDTIAVVRDVEYLTTTIFVKYNYSEDVAYHPPNRLESISVLCLPNGLLQHRYNPNANDGIWLAGRNAPTRGEAFRVRISLAALKNKANWRVQTISADPNRPFVWDD